MKLKKYTTAVTIGTNETWIGRIHENCYLMGEGMTLLTVESLNLLRGTFFVEVVRKCLAVGWDSPHQSLGFPKKVQGNGGQFTPGGDNKTTLEEGTF